MMTCFVGVPRDEAAAALDVLGARLHQDGRLDGDAHQDGHHRHVEHVGKAAAGERECPKSGRLVASILLMLLISTLHATYCNK